MFILSRVFLGFRNLFSFSFLGQTKDSYTSRARLQNQKRKQTNRWRDQDVRRKEGREGNVGRGERETHTQTELKCVRK